jgi:hypothetical protein
LEAEQRSQVADSSRAARDAISTLDLSPLEPVPVQEDLEALDREMARPPPGLTIAREFAHSLRSVMECALGGVLWGRVWWLRRGPPAALLLTG